jgi:hypothetical protein
MAGRPRKTATKAQGQKSTSWQPLALFDHQKGVVEAYKQGIRRFFLGWHRRAGKDVFALDFARERMMERVGTYWHLFPFHVQAKRAIWKGIDARTGQRFIDRAFPRALRDAENDTDMSVTLKNGATWQMLGSDNYDRMVGSNPCGIIFSEWALCDPAAWDYIRPILIENKGWVLFITTFRGRNHAWRMFKTVEDLETWYAEVRTIEETWRRDGTPIVSAADVEEEIKQGMNPALVQQEFYCNPDAVGVGAIFSEQHSRILQLDPQIFVPNSRILRVAWGKYEEGIAAVAFQGAHIVGVHTFLESNITNAAQAVARRHPNVPLIHHTTTPDPSLFGALDGYGVVGCTIGDEHVMHGKVAAMLNACSSTSIAREKLADFTMGYAPFRTEQHEEDERLTDEALAQALAVMHSAQPYSTKASKKLDYSKSDRGVI